MTKDLVIDIETKGLNPAYNTIKGIGRYLPLKDKFIYNTKLGKAVVDHNQIYHNGKFDILTLRRKGYSGLRLDDDTMLQASLLPSKVKGELDLGTLAKKYLNIKNWKVEDHNTATNEEVEKHCKGDCKVTYSLNQLFNKKLKHYDLYNYYKKYLLPAARMLIKVESNGILIDSILLMKCIKKYALLVMATKKQFRLKYKDTIDTVEKCLLIKALGKCKPGKMPKTLINRQEKVNNNPPKFNFNSSQHILVLLDIIKLSIKDIKGKATTSSKLMKYYVVRYPILEGIMHYRASIKLLQFVINWNKSKVGSYIHPTFNLHVTDTGRLSSSNPNLQQVTKILKPVFTAHPGNKLVIADYDQIEPRLTAHFSKDSNLLKVFRNNIDLYGELACNLLNCNCHPNEVKAKFPEQRAIAKRIVLAVTYGMGAALLQFRLKFDCNILITELQAEGYIAGFYDLYPKVKKFKYILGARAMKAGYIKGWFGRKLWLNREEARHKALNYFIQNSASDLTLFSNVMASKKLESIANLRLLVHDECVYETKEENVNKVLHALQYYMVYKVQDKLNVPLKISTFVGDTWEAKE